MHGGLCHLLLGKLKLYLHTRVDVQAPYCCLQSSVELACPDALLTLVAMCLQHLHQARLAINLRLSSMRADSKQVLTASDDMQLHLYEATGNLIEAFSGHESWVLDVAAHPNGTNFLSGSSDSSVKLWDIPQRTCVMTQREHTDQVWSVAMSPDGSEAVSCGDDGRVVTYNLQG